MIGGVDYNNLENMQQFVEKLRRDETELDNLRSRVAQLSQNIKLESSPKNLVDLKESVTLLQSSLDTYNNDILVLKKIASQDELVGKIEKIIKKDIFSVLDVNRGRISRTQETLAGITENHPNLDRLYEEAMQSGMRRSEDMRFLLSIGKGEVLEEKDLLAMRKILKQDPNILFEQAKSESEDSLFSQLMKTPHAHSLFDNIMFVVGQELYEKRAKGLQEILRFAFSRKRYEWCYAQDSHITLDVANKGEKVLEKCTVKGLGLKLAKFQSQRSGKFSAWQISRMGTSNSLTHPYSNRDTLRKHWLTADAYMLSKAFQHVGTTTAISREFIQLIHKKMAAEDDEIPNPGVTRDVLGKQVAAGSSWMNNMCGAPFLSERLDELVSWMNDEFIKCNKGEKNPLIFAAQTYQRVVSLHPFENGNGRMARLMMDYILVRYEIPPVVMGKNEKDVNIAVFPLLPDSTRKPEEFYMNMLERISQSFDALNKELETLD